MPIHHGSNGTRGNRENRDGGVCLEANQVFQGFGRVTRRGDFSNGNSLFVSTAWGSEVGTVKRGGVFLTSGVF